MLAFLLFGFDFSFLPNRSAAGARGTIGSDGCSGISTGRGTVGLLNSTAESMTASPLRQG
jgi:hypothetical protein